MFGGFSPRKNKVDLAEFSRIIGTAKRDVLFSTAFKIYQTVLDSLKGQAHDDILRYGIENTRSTITGVHADRTAKFSAAAMLNTGLEGWLKESTAGQRGSILIHTKLVVVDFTSDKPTVISGSHNLSANASSSNDENFLIIRNDTDVADAYGCELMRIYDHYRFRFRVKQNKTKTGPKLTPNDSWTDRYYEDGNLAKFDRTRFAGA